MKKIVSVLAAAVMCSSAVAPPCVCAQQLTAPTGIVEERKTGATASGTCGESCTWELKDGTLTISGTGDMMDWVGVKYVPWYKKMTEIKNVVISKGITSIGEAAFLRSENLVSVSIPDTVTRISASAFAFSGITSIDIPASVTSLGARMLNACPNLKEVKIRAMVTRWTMNKENVCNSEGGGFGGTIYGYEGSTAQQYAKYNSYDFALLGDTPQTQPAATTGATTTAEAATATAAPDKEVITFEGEAFAKLVSAPTKTEYKQGEALSYTGMMLGAYKVTQYLTEQGEKIRRENIAYIVEWIDPDFVSVIDSEGEEHDVSEFSSLPSGEYTVQLGSYVDFSSYEDHHSIKNLSDVDCSFKVTITEETAVTTTTSTAATTTTTKETTTTTTSTATTTTTTKETTATTKAVSATEAPFTATTASDILYGDANLNGVVELSDAVLIMQALCNPSKYDVIGTDKSRLTEKGKLNADCDGNNDGMTNKDALSIQKYLLKLIDKLPENG